MKERIGPTHSYIHRTFGFVRPLFFLVSISLLVFTGSFILIDTTSERVRKRQRLEITNPSSQIASSSRLGTSATEHDLFPKDTLSMRPPERDYDSNPTTPHIHRHSRSSSSSPSPKANGHLTNGHGSPMNGSSKRSKSPVVRVEFPGSTIYDDSYIDREEYIRLVIQSLRDIGYMCVLVILL